MAKREGRYDFVVYGATGYTGQYVVEEVARVAQMEKEKLKSEAETLSWAVAGRNKDKLIKCIKEARLETGLPLDNVGIIEADVADATSVDGMTAQARVVINCVGPYLKYGEQVVKSCVENGASHVDISGEPVFLEGMQLRYDDLARDKGVYIVGSCGYDSIPADVGVAYLDKQFPGGLNSVEMYGRTTGPAAPIHTGTLESAVGVFSNQALIKHQLEQLFPQPLPKPKFPLPSRYPLHYNDIVKCYGIPFPSDIPVVYRSQRHRHDVQGKLPIQFNQFMGWDSMLQALGMMLGAGYFVALGSFSWTRSLVLKFPEVLTGGFFSRVGADRADLRKMNFISTLVGQGWSTPSERPTERTSPDATKMLKVVGPDPGYAATSLMMVAAAMTILREKDACYGRGGVLTPGIAFADTKIVDRMVARGMSFTVTDV